MENKLKQHIWKHIIEGKPSNKDFYFYASWVLAILIAIGMISEFIYNIFFV